MRVALPGASWGNMQAKQLYHEQIMTTSVGPNHTSSTAWVRLIAAPTVEASGKDVNDKLLIG